LHELRAALDAARPRGEVDDAMTDLLRDCRPALVDLQLAIDRLASGDAVAAATATRATRWIGAAADRASLRALAAQCSAAVRAIGALPGSAATEPGTLDEILVLDRQLELYAAVHREVSALAGGPALLAAACAQLGTGAGPADRPARAALGELIAAARIPSLADALADSAPSAARCTTALFADATAMFEPCPPRDGAAQRFERARRELSDALDELATRVPAADLAPLRAAVECLSLVPLAPRLSSLIRMLATELDKPCDARIELGDVLVPPATGRIVGDILVHAVRNALDHGIEAGAGRTAAGKPASGTIEVAAYAMGDRLVVTVRDDGRGVDLDRVRQRAVERGLLAATVAAATEPAQLLELLFHPGFSTATSVTLVSGRGIGMDVIRSLATERGGSVVIASTAGCGTELTIELPLSAADTA
jgi:two-component system chemotaxis sensor kinase CheA